MQIKQIIQGASHNWEVSLSTYKPSGGWSLVYYFRGSGAGLNLTASEENDMFVLSLSSAQTAAFAVGQYSWQSFAEKAGEKVFIAEGTLQIKQGFASSDAVETFDSRSEIKIILDAIDACIKKKATADQLSYTIGNRQLARYSLAELITARDRYQKLYNQEKLAERLKKGGGIFKTHHIRMRDE